MMKKVVSDKVLITGLIILGIIVISFGVIGFFKGVLGYETITSSGEYSIKVMPDFIAVYFNIYTIDDTAKGASDKNSEIYHSLKSSLIALGYEDGEIKTESFNVYPEYDWTGREQRIKGYAANHVVKIEIPVSEFENVGIVIDSGIAAGAGINYINYEITKENQNKYKAEAIKSATEDAKIKATALAEGAGQRLGKLVSISTSEFGYIPWRAYSEGQSSDAVSGKEISTQITPSEQEISARVVAVYRIR